MRCFVCVKIRCMKRRKLTGWEWALFATPLLSLIAMIWLAGEPLSWRWHFLSPRGQARMSSCQNSLKQLGLGLIQYSRDYNDKFPPAKIGGVRPAAPTMTWNLNPPVGWEDATYAYTKNMSVFNCPASLSVTDPISPRGNSFWLNGNLSAFPLAKLKRPAATLMCGDGNDGREVADGTYSKTSLPPQWLSDYTSPCYRHLGGANYLFADGHAARLRPDAISSAPGAPHTFSTQ